MKIIGRPSAINFELDTGEIMDVFTTAAIAVPFDQTDVKIVDNDGHHSFLIELAEVTSYTPNGGTETAFSGTKDELIDILNEQFFTGGAGGGGGFSPTTAVLQSQITNFNVDTLANAKALTYELNDRVYIEELDETFQAKAVPSGITATGSPTQVGTDLYTISHNANTYGQILRIDSAGSLYNDYQFTATGAVGNKPVGTLLYVNGLLYIETSEGGANNLGTLMSFDPTTKTVAKILDFSSTLGYSQGPLTPLQNNDKALVDVNQIYLVTADGGANNKGTILKVDLATKTGTVIHDLNTTGFGQTTSKGFAVVVAGVYYAFVEDQVIQVDTSTHTVTSVYTESSIAGTLNLLSVGFYDSALNKVFLGFDGDSGGLATYDIATNTYTYKTTASGPARPDAYVIFKEGNFLYAVEYATSTLYKWDYVTNGTIATSTDHVFPSAQVLNGSFDASTGVLYFTQGTGYTTQDKIYKYDVATKTTTLVKDLSIGGITGDDLYIISVNQTGFYLQPRDKHTKTVTLNKGNTLGVQNTRGDFTSLYIQKPYELIENQTYTNSGTALQLFSTGDNLNIDLTSNSIILQQNTTKEFLDAVNDKIVLDEGKVYRILVKISCSPTSQDNRLDLAIRAKSLGFNVSADTQYTNHVTPNQKLAFEFKFKVQPAVAADGVILTVKRFEGGTGLRIYNIDTNIQEIAELI